MPTLYSTAYHGLRAVLLDKSTWWSSLEIYERNSQYAMMGQNSRPTRLHPRMHGTCRVASVFVVLHVHENLGHLRRRERFDTLIAGWCGGSTGSSQSTALNRPIEKKIFFFSDAASVRQCQMPCNPQRPIAFILDTGGVVWGCVVWWGDWWWSAFPWRAMCVSLGKGPSKLPLNGY